MSENTVNSNSILLIGAGNLATSLGVALKDAGLNLVAVWSRTEESARALGERLGVFYSADMASLPQADVVIVAVADEALPQVLPSVAELFPHALVAHTAGSISMDALRKAGCKLYGVFYPMQTFSKLRIVDYSTVSVFVEGCSPEVLERLRSIASRLTAKVYDATSEQRRYLHLAAVFACNFPNALYAMSAELLRRNGLPFEAMLPLIDETALKVHSLHPKDAQTGPARRGDEAVMQSQRALLDDELLTIYDSLSDYIIKNR